MIISVHLPKTAGSSFVSVLQEHFVETLKIDNEDRPLHATRWSRRGTALRQALFIGGNLKGVDCVHGHFLPIKYYGALGRKPTYVTWLRHPIERLISHYDYWFASFDADTAQPLHKKVVLQRWSLEAFCLSPELRNIYDEFLWFMPLKRFDFVGLTEHFEEDLKRFCNQWLGVEYKNRHQNKTERTTRPEMSVDLWAEVERYHSRDMDLYREAVALRKKKVQSETQSAL